MQSRPSQGGSLRLSHGWGLSTSDTRPEIVAEFIRPAVRAVPQAIARRLKRCEISLSARVDDEHGASRWSLTGAKVEIAVATEGVEPHDVALELLICIGQTLWEVVSPAICNTWINLLCTELGEQVTGEIDEQALGAKRALLASRSVLRSRRCWEEYARASFASTVAEYVHCLWHDVTVRTGQEHLPARSLRRRLVQLAEWFPPGRGRRLFAALRRREPACKVFGTDAEV